MKKCRVMLLALSLLGAFGLGYLYGAAALVAWHVRRIGEAWAELHAILAGRKRANRGE